MAIISTAELWVLLEESEFRVVVVEEMVRAREPVMGVVAARESQMPLARRESRRRVSQVRATLQEMGWWWGRRRVVAVVAVL